MNGMIFSGKHCKAAAAAVLIGLSGFLAAAEITSGKTVVFTGDSITNFGARNKSGYVNLCKAGFEANGIKVNVVPKGINGSRSLDIKNRLNRDVLELKPVKPDYMVLMIGVNDVGHFHYMNRGITLERYKEYMTEVIEKVQAAGIKIILLTTTMHGESPQTKNNQKLVGYNAFLRQIAAEKKLVLVDIDKIMRAKTAELRKKTGMPIDYFTYDSLHMDFPGDYMIAEALLRDGFRFTKQEMEKFDQAIKPIKHKFSFRPVEITCEEFQELEEYAHKNKTSVQRLLNKAAHDAVLDLMKKNNIRK